MMKKVSTAIFLILAAFPSFAQSSLKFRYDVNFEYWFDNREFDAGDELYTQSETINAARLTPAVGFTFIQDRDVSHSVMIGIDVLKNMGETPAFTSQKNLVNWDLFQEMTLWYNIEARLDEATFKGYAGIFPRRFSAFGSIDTPSDEIPGRDIPTAFLSDYFRFYDNNIEGVLLTARRENAYYEAGLDWLGMYGSNRREQFKIFSYGKGKLNDWLYAGWAGEAHHYANAVEYGGVVDNILVAPFAEFDLVQLSGIGLQHLSLSLSWLQNLHRDRRIDSAIGSSEGPQVAFDIRNWNVGIRNETYYGSDLMPYYSKMAPEGTIYGMDLYHGNPFYQVGGVSDGSGAWGLYDRLETYFQPHISSFLDLRLSAVFHFADGGFQGWQQKLGLVFNLERAVNSARGSRESRMKRPHMFDLYL